ncbi:MAG: hypothetical protein IT427_09250 [Pirellulales bacterium]|nr:hypothetical protein [Pirellulales bacterium]
MFGLSGAFSEELRRQAGVAVRPLGLALDEFVGQRVSPSTIISHSRDSIFDR